MDPITGLIMGAASLGSSLLGYNASQDAAKQQAAAQAAALAFQKQVFATNQTNLNPFIQTGTGANYTLAQLYGLPGANGQAGAPDFSSFFKSPDYNFAYGQGLNATTNLLSAKGNLMSGGGLTALTNYGQGMGAQQFTNYVGRLQQIANMGQGAAGALAGVNINSGSQIGNTYGQLGTAQAAGTIGGANALAGGLNGVSNAMVLSRILNNNNPSSYGGYNYGNNYAPGLTGSDLAGAASAGVGSGLSFNPFNGSVG